jgi:hypothetical protein
VEVCGLWLSGRPNLSSTCLKNKADMKINEHNILFGFFDGYSLSYKAHELHQLTTKTPENSKL